MLLNSVEVIILGLGSCCYSTPEVQLHLEPLYCPCREQSLNAHITDNLREFFCTSMSGRDIHDVCQHAERRWASKVIYFDLRLVIIVVDKGKQGSRT